VSPVKTPAVAINRLSEVIMESADKSFKKLPVWRRSYTLSIQIYRRRAGCRDWCFPDQITRAANRLSDRIAPGAEPIDKAEFKPILGCAQGSAEETRSQMLRAITLSDAATDTKASSWPNSAKSRA
jgi:four helix bundle protein